MPLSLPLLGPNIFFNIPFPETRIIYSSLKMRDQVQMFSRAMYSVLRVSTCYKSFRHVTNNTVSFKPNSLILLKKACLRDHGMWYFNTTTPIPFRLGSYLHWKPSKHTLIWHYPTRCNRLEKLMDNTDVLWYWNWMEQDWLC
jgi:hypothetical protein